jgi:hypothetical protein
MATDTPKEVGVDYITDVPIGTKPNAVANISDGGTKTYNQTINQITQQITQQVTNQITQTIIQQADYPKDAQFNTLQIGNIASLFKASPEGIHLGAVDFDSAPFRVTMAGALTATSATITGSITATTGAIGGWTIGATTLTAGTAGTSVGLAPGTYPFYAGHSTAASAPFRVSNIGAITASSGTIGGWTINSTYLEDSLVKIKIDAGNSLIRIGATTGNYIALDGTNLRLRSSNYVSGVTGAGFSIEPTFIECGDLRARGKFTSVTFESQSISSIAGSQMVSHGGDVLDSNMTAADASTLTTSGSDTFAVGDLLLIKDSTNEEWLEVTNINSAPTYTVTRDKGSAYSANANPAWQKGTTIVNYGQSGDGVLYQTASEANAPRLSVITHAGAPWTTQTERVRIGNLNGFLGYDSNLYGIAIGETDKYLKYDPTNGLRIKGDSALLDVGAGGYIKGGQTAYDTGTGFFLGHEAGAYKFSIGDATKKLTWDGVQLSVLGTLNADSPIALEGYAMADLPTPPSNTGYNNPTATS